MKKRNTIGWNVLVALALLLAAGAAQAQPVVIFDSQDNTKAIGIDDVVVDGTAYNVDFTQITDPEDAYGPFPGMLDFNDIDLAAEAADAVDDALNGSAAVTVAAEGFEPDDLPAGDGYIIGYGTNTGAGPDQLFHWRSKFDGTWARATPPFEESTPWRLAGQPATSVFALFTDANPTPVSVPDVVDLPEADAKDDIEAVGLFAVVDEQPHETVPAGTVISQDPAAGAMVDPGSDVTIVVSTGPQPQLVSVPDVVGLSEADAVMAIRGVDLVEVVNEQFSETVPAGTVISQSPTAATMVGVGSDVTIVVSTGMAPQTIVNFDPNETTKAIGIDNLFFDLKTYNVVFTASTTADMVYGPYPGSFDLDVLATAGASDAVNVALTTAAAGSVGAEELQGGSLEYSAGYSSFAPIGVESLAAFKSLLAGDWARAVDGDIPLYNTDERVFAVFSEVVPEPGSTPLMAAALATLGVVRRWRRQESEGTA